MSYSIYIGNTEMRLVEDEEWVTAYPRTVNGKVRYYEPVVKEIRRPDAPTFPNDEMTGNSNGRHPSYSGWGDFCRVTGLYGLFYASYDGLMPEHPGHAEIRPEHATTIENALNVWKAAHPNAVPGFEEWSLGDDAPEQVGYDPILARLIWLDWWVKWALANCEHPGIYNY